MLNRACLPELGRQTGHYLISFDPEKPGHGDMINVFIGYDPREAVGSEMMWSLLRHYYKVGVSYAIAMDQISDPLERELFTYAPAEPLSDDDDSLCDVV
jgi:hypothetical protein